ncbi:MAG: GEVED domain-containing protein [Chitinophagales bacterium]
MKKSTLLALALLLISAFSFAGVSVDWIRSTDNILSNSGTAVARDKKDNVYTTTHSTGIFFTKRDKFGNFLWQVSSSTTIPFNYEYPSWIHIDPQGNPVVVGFRYTSPSEGKHANSLIVLKYDPDGNLLYKKNIDGDFSYFQNSPLSMYWTKITSQMDSSGNVYIGTSGGVTGYPSGFTVVKVSPAGSLLWVSAKTFTSATSFHFVNNIRLKADRIAVSGVTSYSSANATHWVLDTTGTSLWSNIQEGIGGKDAAFDKAGNVYFLTWVSPNFSGDVRVYKFNTTGSLLWQKTYDFGGGDLAARMEYSSTDNSIVIMAYGNQNPPGSLYVDWITFKIKPNGTMAWSKRYDKHPGNDEIPGMMAVDKDGDIFVTGIAGPFPGGSNLGKRQMVTVKYTTAGIEEWVYALDTINEYNEGVGIAIAKNGSVYVVGSVNTLLVHLLDNTGTDPCGVPVNINVSAITNQTATISWSPVANAYLYHIQYKTSTSIVWTQISTNTTSFTLTSLAEGTTYNYKVEAVCNSGPTGFSPAAQFTTLGTGYCASKGLDASKEWIDLVYVGSLLNSTPVSDGGYADYTYLSVDFVQSGSYSMTLSADMNPYGSTEFWRVWIDYNQDGDFTDAGEQEVAYKSTQIGWESHTFSVPATALTGPTRMRVSMKHGAAPSPCEIFNLGEVEDYTVNILPAKMSEGATAVNNATIPDLFLAPNPSTGNTTISFNGFEGNITLQVFDVTGKLTVESVISGSMLALDVSEWTPGLYFVRMTDDAGHAASKKLLKQ